jgi:hypothetical protein
MKWASSNVRNYWENLLHSKQSRTHWHLTIRVLSECFNTFPESQIIKYTCTCRLDKANIYLWNFTVESANAFRMLSECFNTFLEFFNYQITLAHWIWECFQNALIHFLSPQIIKSPSTFISRNSTLDMRMLSECFNTFPESSNYQIPFHIYFKELHIGYENAFRML